MLQNLLSAAVVIVAEASHLLQILVDRLKNI